jgi:tape measure domain-containing protein
MAGKRGIEAGRAYVQAYLDDTLLKRGLRGLRTTFATAFRVAMVGASAGATAGIGGVMSALSRAAEMEQTQTAFSTMLGSAERAKDVIADLRKFAAQTPFEFTELAQATKLLLAFGTPVEELIPTLRTLGDISSGIGAPLGEIAELFGKNRVQGRLFMADINQMTNRGIPVIQELARQFGVAEGQVRKLVESGQVNFGHMQEAFRALTAEGGRFHGMMDAQSRTLAGRWSTLKDAWGSLMLSVGERLMPVASALVEQFSNIAQSWEGMVQRMGQSWGNLVNFLSRTQYIRTLSAMLVELDEKTYRLMGRLNTALADNWKQLGVGPLAHMFRGRAAENFEHADRLAREAHALRNPRPEVLNVPNLAGEAAPAAGPNRMLIDQLAEAAKPAMRRIAELSSVGTFSGRAAGLLGTRADPVVQKLDEQLGVMREIEKNTEEFGMEFE